MLENSNANTNGTLPLLVDLSMYDLVCFETHQNHSGKSLWIRNYTLELLKIMVWEFALYCKLEPQMVESVLSNKNPFKKHLFSMSDNTNYEFTHYE